MSYKRLWLVSAFVLATTAYAGSEIQNLFENLITGSSKSDPSVVLNAQLNPYVSAVLTNNSATCGKDLESEDLAQMQYDQFLVQSLLDLYKIPSNEREILSGSILYMSILLQKIRGPLDAIAANNRNSSNVKYLSSLSQSDFAVANFMMSAEGVRNINRLVKAHQSLELPVYNIDSYLKLALEEYQKCSQDKSLCTGSEGLWMKWFVGQGFGIVSPLVTDDMSTEGNQTNKNNFEVSLKVTPYTSEALVKKMFELINIYGGEKFDYFAYLNGEKLKAEQGLNGGQMNAPGKVLAGLLLKVANQRLVAYYKYQKCRLLKQNGTNAKIVASSYSRYSNKPNKKRIKSKRAKHVISTCTDSTCGNGTQVSSGDHSLAIASAPATAEVAAATGIESCSAGQIWNGQFCFTCFEGWEPAPSRTSCMGSESFCNQAANKSSVACIVRERDINTAGPVSTSLNSSTNNSVFAVQSDSNSVARANFESYCGTGSRKSRSQISRDEALSLCNQCDATLGAQYKACKWGNEILASEGAVPAFEGLTSTTITASEQIPALADSATLSNEVKSIYQYIGRNADKIDAEGAAYFQSRIDAGESVESLQASALAMVNAIDQKLRDKGASKTSQEFLNGDSSSRAEYYRLMSSASNQTPPVSPPVSRPVTPPPVAGPVNPPAIPVTPPVTPVTPPSVPSTPPASSISCGQLVEALAWDSAINPYAKVAGTETGFEIHFSKKSTSIQYPFTNFDPAQAGFAINFIESGKSITVPADAYTISPLSNDTKKGFTYAYRGEYGSVNLKFHISRHSSLAGLGEPIAELTCGGRTIMKSGSFNLKPLVDLSAPPTCKSILGKVVGDSCVFLGPCAKKSRASAELNYATQKGYTSCRNAQVIVNPECPAESDMKYIGKCPLMDPSELP